jgi:hypothetical protein
VIEQQLLVHRPDQLRAGRAGDVLKALCHRVPGYRR